MPGQFAHYADLKESNQVLFDPDQSRCRDTLPMLVLSNYARERPMKASSSMLFPQAVAMAFAVIASSGVALFAPQKANAVECGSTANRAGCVGPRGAATYNKNTGQVHTAQPYYPNRVAPGTKVEGSGGNTATKAIQPGCAYVNGRKVCN